MENDFSPIMNVDGEVRLGEECTVDGETTAARMRGALGNKDETRFGRQLRNYI